MTENGTNFQLEFYPLASGSGGHLRHRPHHRRLHPPSVHLAASEARSLSIEQFLVPLVGNTLLCRGQEREFATTLWTGGPTVQSVLTGSAIAVTGGGGLVINPSFPSITSR